MSQRVEALPGPRPDQVVRLAVPGKGRVSATITHVAPRWLSLRLAGRARIGAGELCGRPVTLEYVVDDGFHRLLGELERVSRDAPYALRFITRSGPQFLGRRRHVRTALSAPVVLVSEVTGVRYRTRSLNVSESGMLVAGLPAEARYAGAQFRFVIIPRDCSEPIRGRAVLSRVDHSGKAAFVFEGLPQRLEDELARVVFEHEQDSRALRRAAS